MCDNKNDKIFFTYAYCKFLKLKYFNFQCSSACNHPYPKLSFNPNMKVIKI